MANKPIRWLLSSAVFALALNPLARAGDDRVERPTATVAPLELPHTLDVMLNEQARKRARKPVNLDGQDLFEFSPGLRPVTWPKASDVRQRILTPEVRRTPVVGWIAENLYKSKNDSGWCLEVDPGEGEYIVFYRFHPKK